MPASIHSDAGRKNSTLAKKRGVAIAALDERPHRPVKRRASKACQCCRSRKVRCNVVEHGAPCTNCRLDQVDCVITESKRKRKSISYSDADHVQLSVNTNIDASTQQDAPWTPPPSGQALEQNPAEHIPHQLYRSHETTSPVLQQMPRSSISSSMESETMSPTWNFPHNFNKPVAAYAPPHYTQQEDPSLLPDFIKPLPKRLDAEETAFLQSKEALKMPDLDLRDALLRSYADFVDPSMPILDLDGFTNIIRQGDGAFGKVSLLVFHAVMFAGSSFVDLSYLRRAGYSSRQQARRSLYAKARLLYDHDYEADRVAIIQTLLLFTYWYETPDDPKDTWHWVGIATSVAQSIGMNRKPSQSSLDHRTQALWKRVWWSCVVRDRLIAIGMRRPTRIRDHEHDVPMLTLNDFSLVPLNTHMSYWNNSYTLQRSPSTQRSLALIFIEQAKLCHCIGNVVITQYTSPPTIVGANGQATVAKLLPKKQGRDGRDTKHCNDQLADWMSNLPEEVQLHPEHATNNYNASDDAPVTLNRSLLHMVHYMTLSALHRPHAVRSGTLAAKVDADTGMPKTPEGHIRLAAFRITEILQNLHCNGLARFLPTTGITVLQPAIINHLLDVKSENEEVRMEGLRGFCQCFQVLARLKAIYPGAEYSVMIVDAAVKRANLNCTPWFRTAPGPRPTKIDNAQQLVHIGLKLGAVAPEPAVDDPSKNNGLLALARNQHTAHSIVNRVNAVRNALSPPLMPGEQGYKCDNVNALSDVNNEAEVGRQLSMFLAMSPPTSANSSEEERDEEEEDPDPDGEDELDEYERAVLDRDLDRDFERLINVDLDFEEGGCRELMGDGEKSSPGAESVESLESLVTPDNEEPAIGDEKSEVERMFEVDADDHDSGYEEGDLTKEVGIVVPLDGGEGLTTRLLVV